MQLIKSSPLLTVNKTMNCTLYHILICFREPLFCLTMNFHQSYLKWLSENRQNRKAREHAESTLPTGPPIRIPDNKKNPAAAGADGEDPSARQVASSPLDSMKKLMSTTLGRGDSITASTTPKDGPPPKTPDRPPTEQAKPKPGPQAPTQTPKKPKQPPTTDPKTPKTPSTPKTPNPPKPADSQAPPATTQTPPPQGTHPPPSFYLPYNNTHHHSPHTQLHHRPLLQGVACPRGQSGLEGLNLPPQPNPKLMVLLFIISSLCIHKEAINYIFSFFLFS